jgi:hypothetical protein
MPGYRKLVDSSTLYPTVVLVTLDTALAVQATGATFALLVCGSDLGSVHMDALLRTALQHHQPGILALKVVIVNHTDANRLAATMVPQLRVYRGGQETARQRGTMDYGRLIEFLHEAVI